MKKILVITAICLLSIISQNNDAKAQGPRGKDFGFGLILGDPTGGTIKYWFNRENALVASLGNSYFGALRINVDYLWHFDAFNSQVVKMYAGIGGVLGFGEGHEWYYKHGKDKFYYRTDETGIAVRAMIGLNIIPRNTPIEIFLELGPLIGIVPDFGSTIDAAVGIRFYL